MVIKGPTVPAERLGATTTTGVLAAEAVPCALTGSPPPPSSTSSASRPTTTRRPRARAPAIALSFSGIVGREIMRYLLYAIICHIMPNSDGATPRHHEVEHRPPCPFSPQSRAYQAMRSSRGQHFHTVHYDTSVG